MKKTKTFKLLLILATIASNTTLGQELHHLSKPEVDVGLIIDNDASDPKISRNGRYIAFKSKASNLVANDSNHSEDVFIKDRNTGVTQLVSVTASAVQLEKDSYIYQISSPTSDGRFVAFVSDSALLPFSDGVNKYMYIKDMQTGALLNASSYDSGNAYFSVDGPIYLSNDGLVIVFSTGNQIDPLHTSSINQVYRKDLTNMSFELLSISSDGLAAADTYTELSHVSASGHFVLLNSFANNLTADVINNNGYNLFIRDLQTSTTTLVNITPAGASSSDFETQLQAEISDLGQVVFVSGQDDLVNNDNNNKDDVFYYYNGAMIRINLDSNGNELLNTGIFKDVAISADGSRIAFTEDSDEIFPTLVNDSYDLYTYETSSGTLSLISQTPSGNKANSHSYTPQLNSTGNRLVFSSPATDMTVELETGLINNLFYYNFNTSVLKNESVAAFSPNTLLSDALYAQTSSDQKSVVYVTRSPNILTEPIDDKTYDLFLLDRNSDTHSIVSRNVSSYKVDISTSGNYISFRTYYMPPDGITNLGAYYVYLFDRANNTFTQIAPGGESVVNNDGIVAFLSYDNLDINDTNNLQDVYVYNPSSQNITLVSKNLSGAASSAVAMDIGGSGNNTSVTFSSNSADIVADDTNASDDIFVKNVTNNAPISRITKTMGGIEANNDSYNPVLSEDAKWVAFETSANNLTNDDYSLTYYRQILVYDRDAQSYSLVSKNDQGMPVTAADTGGVIGVSISDTGRYVSYVYLDIVDAQSETSFTGDNDYSDDVILFDTVSQSARLISKHLNGAQSSDIVDSNIQVVEDLSVMPSKVGVIFMAKGGDLTQLPNHPGHQEVFLYQTQEQDFDLIFQNSYE